MQKIFSAFKSLPIILVLTIGSFLLLRDNVDVFTKSLLYAMSLSIKDCLVFLMPFIITSCIFSMLVALGKSSYLFVIRFITCVFCSNFLCTLIAYAVGYVTLSDNQVVVLHSSTSNLSLEPLWKLGLAPFISNDYALLIGIVLGTIFSYYSSPNVEKIANFLQNLVSLFLKKIFIPLVPLFILGFIAKLDYDNVLMPLYESQKMTLVIIFTVQYSYVIILYFIASNGSFKQMAYYLKNILPSAVTAFCTMSSAATVPVTLEAAEKNTKNNPMAKAVVIGTANIHLIGDSIGVSLMAIAILLSFKSGFPALAFFSFFAIHFVAAKFCVAAVPGGGIIVMIPVMEQYLGFSPEMSALISAFYIMFDPINTAANVSGNGAFVLLFTKAFSESKKYIVKTSSSNFKKRITVNKPVES